MPWSTRIQISFDHGRSRRSRCKPGAGFFEAIAVARHRTARNSMRAPPSMRIRTCGTRARHLRDERTPMASRSNRTQTSVRAQGDDRSGSGAVYRILIVEDERIRRPRHRGHDRGTRLSSGRPRGFREDAIEQSAKLHPDLI